MEKKDARMDTQNNSKTNEFVMPEGSFAYACCGNCRYYDGATWCGYHQTNTTGGDHCSYWEE